MPNRIASFAVLFFSFALLMLGFQPPPGSPIIGFFGKELPIPVPSLGAYRVMGLIAIALSLFFIIVALRKKWSDNVESVVLGRNNLSYIMFIIFWLVSLASFIKGISGMVSSSPPAWIVDLVTYFGLALVFITIPILYGKWFLEKK